MLGKIEDRRGRWDNWMASLMQWTWTWANFRRWWGTGGGVGWGAWCAAVHGVLRSQTSLGDWTTTTKFIYFVCIFIFLIFFNFYFYFILLYNTVLVLPYIDMNPPWVYMSSQTWTPLPPSTPYHLSGSSPCTSPKHPVSCIGHRLVIHLLHNSIHVSMPFSQIIPPSPSPTESKSPSVSLLLSRIQGYHYHLSKLHIYVLVYCIGVFLSGLLHSA